jgi:hypothetical protein
VLQSLGIINNNTRLAGSSGGAITAAAICSNVPAATQQLAANFNIAAACRPSLACRGYLDSVVRNHTDDLFPESVTEQCKQRLYVTVTEARPNNLTDPPQVIANTRLGQRLLLRSTVCISFRATAFLHSCGCYAKFKVSHRLDAASANIALSSNKQQLHCIAG